MKFSTAALSCLFLARSVLGTTFTGTITISNEAPADGTCLTPVWVGVHDGTFDTYDSGVAASAALESLAEDGSSALLQADFAASSGGVWDGVVGSAPFCPGDSVTASFEVTDDQSGPLYFSYAAMILPSNDAFVANGNPMAHEVLSSSGSLSSLDFTVAGSEVLDAGTEVNDELPDNTAFFGQSSPNTGTDENAVVGAHPGFNAMGSGGILDSASFSGADFTASGYNVMRVVVSLSESSSGSDSDDNNSGSSTCFSGFARADVLGVKGGLAMKDLQVGDLVRTGNNRYQPVFSFAHYKHDQPTEFVKISHEAGNGAAIELSAEHLLYVRGQPRPVRADSIAPGDILVSGNDDHAHGKVEAKVTKTSKVTRKGFYAPLTADGSIVVDGVVASTYATLLSSTSSEKIDIHGWTFPLVDQAFFLHQAVTPLRMLCRASSSKLELCQESYDEEGFNAYVSWGVHVIRWAEEQSTVVQIVMLVFFLAVFSGLRFVELTVLGGGEPLIQGMICLVTVMLMVGRVRARGTAVSGGKRQNKKAA